MRVGSLEIQLMADMARLSRDMKRAEQVVGGSMMKVESSVASAKRAMQALGVGLPLAMIADQVRRMTDSYTKLDAQMRLATKSQAQYAQGMTDVRRISAIAQADINATSMLYTRLINVMDGSGISQSKLATVTETVSFGLKAYGASAQEASSAALQLSQAMGANRLGGEEFRAVMEAMPNVMKVLANSMGVPLGELRALSIAGKITADEMVKAFGNPAVAAEFKRMAENARTITGAWVVARNEFMLLVGEFMKSSGATGALIAGFDSIAIVIKLIADNTGILLNALYAYVTVTTGRLIVGMVASRVAAAELAAANLAQAESALFAAKANLAGAAAAARAGGSMKLAAQAAREYAAASAAVAAAEKAQAAGSIGIAGRIKGAVGKAGWIGMALFGVWSVVDFLNGMQQVADGADQLKNKFEGLTLAEVQMARQRELIRQIGMRGMFQDDSAIQNSQDMIRAYDAQIAKLAAVANAENAAANSVSEHTQYTHDQMVLLTKYAAILEQKEKYGLSELEFEKKVRELYLGSTKALDKKNKAIDEHLAKLREEVDTYGMAADAAARYEIAKLGGNVIQQEQAAAEARHAAELKKIEKYTKEQFDIRKRGIDRVAQYERDDLLKRQKAYDDFANSVTDSLLRGFKSGNVGQAILDSLQSTFEENVLRPQIKAVVTEAMDLFNFKDAALVANTSALNANTAAQGTSSGASGAGAALGSGGSMSGAGAALGYAAVILAIAQIGFGAFNSQRAIGGNRLVGQFDREGFTGDRQQSMMYDRGVFGGTDYWTEHTAILDAERSAFKSTIDSTQRALNGLGSAIGDTGVRTRDWSVSVNEAGDVTGLLVDGMVTQLIPSLRKFQRVGETLIDTATRLTSVFKSTNDFIVGLSLTSTSAFGAEGMLSAGQRTRLVEAAGGDQRFAQLVSGFMGSILTPAERLQVAFDSVGRTFADLGVVGVETNAQFAELVRQTLASGDYSAVTALLEISDAFAQITASAQPATVAMQDMAKSAQEAADKLIALVKQSSFSSFQDYQRMIASIQAGVPAAGKNGQLDYVAPNMPEGYIGTNPVVGGPSLPGLTDRVGRSPIQEATDRARGTLGGEREAARLARESAARTAAYNAAKAELDALAMAQPRKRTRDDGFGYGTWNRTVLPGLIAQWQASLEAKRQAVEAMPKFASGGVHSGGMRVVGENGPEIEYTGPSTIVSNSDSRRLLDVSGVIASVDALRAELRALGVAIAPPMQKQAKILDRWDGQGIPAERVP